MFDSPHSILDYVDNKHPNISFTCDKEQNETLTFLDISLKSDSVSLKTSIYKKTTFTGVLSKFYDVAPKQYKESLICILISRAFQISSDYFALDSEIELLE